jgi:hypothetical protein
VYLHAVNNAEKKKIPPFSFLNRRTNSMIHLKVFSTGILKISVVTEKREY